MPPGKMAVAEAVRGESLGAEALSSLLLLMDDDGQRGQSFDWRQSPAKTPVRGQHHAQFILSTCDGCPLRPAAPDGRRWPEWAKRL